MRVLLNNFQFDICTVPLCSSVYLAIVPCSNVNGARRILNGSCSMPLSIAARLIVPRIVNGMASVIKKPSKCELVKAMIVFVILVLLIFLGNIPQLFRIYRIKIARVRVILDARFVRRLGCSQRHAEVDAGKERMLLDVGPVPTEPVVLAGAEPHDEVVGLLRQAGRPRHDYELLPVDHLELGLGRGVGQERRLPDQHLVQDDADTPPVAQLGVALSQQHLKTNSTG